MRIRGAVLSGAAATMLFAGCVQPPTSDDYAFIEFQNDTHERVVLEGCWPSDIDFTRCEGNDYGGSDDPIRIAPGDTASTSMATGLSLWRERDTGQCFLITGWDGVHLTVPISRGKPCKQLTTEAKRGLCPDSSSAD